jgi:PAS domain S-box-containing protein
MFPKSLNAVAGQFSPSGSATLALIVEKTTNAVVVTDVERRIVWVNRGFERLTGYTLQDVAGKSPGAVLQFSKTDRGTIQRMREALDRQEPFQGRILNRSKSGAEYWLELDIQPLFDNACQLQGFMAIESDVTQLVQAREAAERALRENMALRTALDQHTIFSISDCDGRIIEINHGACQASGYSREELIGGSHRIFNSRLHSDQFWSNMWRTVTSGNCWRQEVCNRRRDGSYYWLDLTIIPQFGSSGKVERYVSLGFDITDRKLAEARLLEANEKNRMLALAVDRSPEPTVVTDLQGIVRFFNPAAAQLDGQLGYVPSIGKPGVLFAAGRAQQQDRDRMIRTVLSGRAFEAVLQIKADRPHAAHDADHDADHESPSRYRLLKVTASPLVTDSGLIDGILISKKDVTEDTLQQRELEELKMALDAATDCVFMFDADTLRMVYVNQGAMEQVGMNLESMRLITPVDILPEFDEATYRALIQPLRENSSRSLKFRSQHLHLSGQRIPVEISLRYIPELGQNGRFIAIVRDIAQQLAAERAMETAKVQAEASSRSKSVFLANMSHEIRTPMTAILGFADLLDSSPEVAADPAQATQAVQTIRSNANHLLTIINDILDMSKIEAGRMTVEQIDTNPVQIVEEVLSLMRPRAVGKGISLGVHYETLMPRTVKSDPTRLRQILLNLVGNAIKFTEVGGVMIHVTLEQTLDRMLFRISDTGIGMKAEHCEKVARFEAFTQADESMTRQFGGTGLGLRISSSLARMLGGAIYVESELGRGSSFTLSMATGPLDSSEFVEPDNGSLHHVYSRSSTTAPNPSGTSSGTQTRLQGVRILLAEDGPDNQRLISFHLKKAGAEVTVAENGRIAAELIERDPLAFDLIFMDMQMPELDGYAATRRLRSRGISLPIIALTAHAMDGDRQKCLDAGCDSYTSKPIDREQLIDIAATFSTGVEKPNPAIVQVDYGTATCVFPPTVMQLPF